MLTSEHLYLNRLPIRLSRTRTLYQRSQKDIFEGTMADLEEHPHGYE